MNKYVTDTGYPVVGQLLCWSALLLVKPTAGQHSAPLLVNQLLFQWSTHLTRQVGINSHWVVSSLPDSFFKLYYLPLNTVDTTQL